MHHLPFLWLRPLALLFPLGLSILAESSYLAPKFLATKTAPNPRIRKKNKILKVSFRSDPLFSVIILFAILLPSIVSTTCEVSTCDVPYITDSVWIISRSYVSSCKLFYYDVLLSGFEEFFFCFSAFFWGWTSYYYY